MYVNVEQSELEGLRKFSLIRENSSRKLSNFFTIFFNRIDDEIHQLMVIFQIHPAIQETQLWPRMAVILAGVYHVDFWLALEWHVFHEIPDIGLKEVRKLQLNFLVLLSSLTPYSEFHILCHSATTYELVGGQ